MSRTAIADIRTLPGLASPVLTRGRSSVIPPPGLPDPIHRRIEQRAASNPQQIAVIAGGRKVTYGELNGRANRLARYLRRMTPSPATPVGIFIEPCIGTVVYLLAALKAGNPYIPLDPNGAPMQTAAMLAETEAFILLPSESTPACLPARRARAISIQSEFENIECGSTGNLSRSDAEGPGRAAFYAFSTGPSSTEPFSTGQRGAAVSHRACLDSMESFQASPGVGADWLISAPRPDLALSGMWMLTPLVYGTRLILASGGEEGISDELLLDQIERSRAIVLRATPAIATALLNAKWQVRTKLRIIRGAEAWPDELLKAFDVMGVEVWQLHGTAVSYRLRRNDSGAVLPASRAAANGGQS